MKRNERGVTLIALVVTIVVLLILAGTAIAMLSGDDGIMTNAQRSQAANTEGEIREKIKMAYNAVKTEISVNSAIESDYNAQEDIKNLFKIAVEEMGLTVDASNPNKATDNTGKGGYTVTYNKPASGAPIIYFEYRDNKFGGAKAASIDKNVISQGVDTGNQKIKKNDGTTGNLNQIKANISFATDNATLTMDPAQVL